MDKLGNKLTEAFDGGQSTKKPGGAAKKLKKFHEKGASLSSRFKSLISFVEKASDEEMRKFFDEFFHVIYGVFLDTFSSYENQCKRGKHDASILKDLLTILKSVLDYLSDYVKKGWQIRSIATVLEKVLYIENKHAFRKQAFELLMQFLEEVRLREEAQTDLLGAAINLQPLAAKYNGVNLMALPLSAPDKMCILLPSNGAVTIQESVELFDILLSFLDQPDTDIFLFWWDLLKQQYLCVFYPTIWPQKTGPGKIGFQKCPEEIQAVLLTRLLSIVKRKNLIDALWKGEDDKQLLLVIFEQSIKLHVNFDETIKKSITVFKTCYMETPPPTLSESELVAYRTVFIKELLAILTSKQYNDNESMKKLEALSLEIVHMFKDMFAEPYALDDKTLEVLYFTLLETASEVLSPNTTRPSLSMALHGDLCDTILFIWIITRTKNPVHWEKLCSTMAGLLPNNETINQVSKKIMQLTMVLQEKIYFIKTEKKKRTGKRPGMLGGEQSAKHMEPKSPDSANPPSSPPKDELIHRIDWSVEDILFVWQNMLQIFGTINSLKPAAHLACLEKLWEVINYLMWSESRVPYQETLDPERPPFLCVIDIFGHLLFSACDLPDAFVAGKAQAFKILCRMFCHDHIRPLPLYLLSHFYNIIQEGLISRDNKNAVQDSIISNSSNIFNMALPGANVLIPYYLVEVKRILTGEGRSSDVKERAVIILSSLICFSSHFNGTDIPVGGSNKEGASTIQDFVKALSGSTVRGQPLSLPPFPVSGLGGEVLSIMTDALKLELLEPIIKVRLIWGICVSLFEIVFSCPSIAFEQVVQGTVCLLLNNLSGQSRIVIRAVVHAITCLAAIAEQICGLYPTVLPTVVESVSANIVKEISEFRSNRSYPIDEALVSDQLYCLLEWLLVCGQTVTNDPHLIGTVFESLENALTGVVMNVSNKPSRKSRKSERPSTSMMDLPVEDLYAQSINIADQTNVALPQIREAAENVVLHLLHFQHNVPPKEGVETLCSYINHTDDVPEGQERKALHFVHNDSLVFSLVEIPKLSGEGNFARVIVRDCLGKYAWDTDIAFDFDKMEPCPALPFQFIEEVIPAEPIAASPRFKIPEPAVDPNEMPTHTKVYDQEVDQLDLLLRHLSHKHEDLLPESRVPLHAPAVCMEAQKARIKYTEQALVWQMEEDGEGMIKRQQNVPPSTAWQMLTPEPQVPLSPFHHCRMLLSHLGFLSYENFGTVSLLGGENEKVLRSLNQLDLTNGREMIKVGLIYLREGQEEQIEVLRNDSSSRSPLFQEYVRSVGWPIDVQTHRGYLGGLDPKLTTGVTAPYYATSTFELIFHDLTSMPTTEEPQQIHKKRHVGNDNVHIVWTEHLRDYNPRTIVSEFNDAHIVIYPLPNGLFKIHVYQKENVELFGPLIHGMVVSKRLLPALTRVTCLMANKYVRYTHEGYVTPFANRKRVLTQIVERHKIDAQFHEIIGNVIP